jgi:hypothetical protein
VQHDGFCRNSDNYRQQSLAGHRVASNRIGTHISPEWGEGNFHQRFSAAPPALGHNSGGFASRRSLA